MSLNTDKAVSGNVARLAFRFVLIIGVVIFFADMTYEEARGHQEYSDPPVFMRRRTACI